MVELGYSFLQPSDVLALHRRFGGVPRARAEVFEPYWRAYLRAPLPSQLAPPAYDMVFVLPSSSAGWILEGICRDVGRAFPGTWTIHEGLHDLPPARGYFYAHPSFFGPALLRNPELWERANFVFFTHPRSDGDQSEEELTLSLGCATEVLSMCSLHAEWLVERGVPRRKVSVGLAGADPAAFRPHTRGSGAVGLCGAYYPRKAPERILDVVRLLPERSFLMLGRGWEAWEGFAELEGSPNFTYVEAPYADYPEHYARMDVFLAPARLEGGPIPLLEAMMCNAVPVASRTGFAPDLIEHGRNGLLFEPDASSEAVARLVERAFSLRGSVADGVRHLSWERYAQTLALKLERAERRASLLDLRRLEPVTRRAARLAMLASRGLRALGVTDEELRFKRRSGVVRELGLEGLWPTGPDEQQARGGGERQAAPSIRQIRADHVARYRFAVGLLERPTRILDMACGVGYGAHLLAQSPHAQAVLGVDRSPEAVAYGRVHYRAEGLELREGDVFHVALPEAGFELGTCFETLEHVVDAAGLLKRFWRALAPGGRLVVSTPNQDVLPFDPQRFRFHVRHYRASELEELLVACGFEVEERLHQSDKRADDLLSGWDDGAFLVAVCRRVDGADPA